MAHIYRFPSADTMRCYDCGIVLSEDDSDQVYEHTVSTPKGLKFFKLCRVNKCSPACEFCGEWLDDASLAESECGPVVTVRQWEADGVLMSGHAVCIADRLLQIWSGDKDFYTLDRSRAEIAAVVRDAFTTVVAA